MPDVRGHSGQQRHRARDAASRPTAACVVAALTQMVSSQLDALELFDRGDIDEILEVSDPERQQCGQALSAGQDLAILAVMVQVSRISSTVSGR
jgi:hypothetical protein